MKSLLRSTKSRAHLNFPYYYGESRYFKDSFLKRKIKLVRIADILINDMNIARNDIVMVHTSLRYINLIDSKPEDLIYLLKMIIGTGGTLLMPTFRENQNEFLSSELTNDLRSSIVSYGLINELFRRMPDTIQGSHQVESFAAWGKLAKSIAENHYSSDNGFDNNSLFYKLSLLKAKIIGIGVPLSNISFFHSDDINLRPLFMISKHIKEDEAKDFKRRNIPFFWLDSESVYNRALLLAKNRS
jgi:aminoglycoside N3'-acetyltransferase